MKKPSFKLKSILLSFLTLLGFLSVVFSSVTYAKYVFGKKTQQSAYGLGGERYISIFFNVNIWAQGKDSSGNIVDANYYMYVWNTSNESETRKVLIPSAHVTPTISGVKMDLYVFEYDATTLNRFLFLRWNPDIAPSADLTYGTGHGKWNQTDDISYTPSKNYYCIDAWGTGNPAQATPTDNKIIKVGNNLSWAS